MTLGSLAVTLESGSAPRTAHGRADPAPCPAGAPLLLNALIVGDLASAEQTLANLNADRSGARAALRARRTHAHPGRLARPAESRASRLGPALHAPHVRETRLPIAADPVVYAVLAVTPSSAPLEAELWAEIRTAVTMPRSS